MSNRRIASALCVASVVFTGPEARAIEVLVADRALMIIVGEAEALSAYGNPLAANAMGAAAAYRVMDECGFPKSTTGWAASNLLLAPLAGKYAWDIGGRVQQTQGRQAIALRYPANFRAMCRGLHSDSVAAGDLVPGKGKAVVEAVQRLVGFLASLQPL